MLDPRTRIACMQAVNRRELEYARDGLAARQYGEARRVLDQNGEDKNTLATCLRALSVRELACARRGLSARHWSRARRLVRQEILHQSAADLRARVPALLQRQAD